MTDEKAIRERIDDGAYTRSAHDDVGRLLALLDAERTSVATLTAERDAARARIEADAESVAEASRTWAVLTNRDWMEARETGSAIEKARECMESRKKALLERASAEAERDALAAQVAALTAPLVTLQRAPFAWEPAVFSEMGSGEEGKRALNEVCAAWDAVNTALSATAQAAADHDARVRREALEEAAKVCEERAADLSRTCDEAPMRSRLRATSAAGQVHVADVAARIRALAARVAKEGG